MTALITLQPGGMLALHDHVDLPALIYVLQGGGVDWRRYSEAMKEKPQSHVLRLTRV